MTPEDITNRFMFHPASDTATQEAHELVRAMCLNLAGSLNDLLPEGREKSLAMTTLETVMFWGNAAIARNGRFPDSQDKARDDDSESGVIEETGK